MLEHFQCILRSIFIGRLMLSGNLTNAVDMLIFDLLQLFDREIQCIDTLVGHALNSPRAFLLNQGIACPEPMSPRFFVNCSCLGHFWQWFAVDG